MAWVEVVSGFCLGGANNDVNPGDVIKLSEAEAHIKKTAGVVKDWIGEAPEPDSAGVRRAPQGATSIPITHGEVEQRDPRTARFPSKPKEEK